MPPMRRAAIFVLSDVRSGSTLLDQCLGAHAAIFSLGEVHWLSAYLSENRAIYNPAHALVCTCGKRVAECAFWSSTADALGRRLEDLTLHAGLEMPQGQEEASRTGGVLLR